MPWRCVVLFFSGCACLLTGCTPESTDEATGPEDPLRKLVQQARFYDYQTRYLVTDETARGFQLQVFVNARGRSFGHAGLRLVSDSMRRVAARHAEQEGRAIRPLDSNDIDLGVEQIATTGEWLWIASGPVAWAIDDPPNQRFSR